MSEWKKLRLGDVCTRVTSGGTPKSTVREYYDGGSIPWLNTKEVDFNRINSTEKYITQKGLDSSAAKWIDADSIIVAMYGATAGKSAVTKIPLTTNQACCNLTIDKNKADYRFIYYSLYLNYTNLASLANGGAQQNLNSNHIKDFEIALPSLPEQTRIAEILGALDDKIELNNRINKNLEEQAQALFKRWFVDFEFPNEEGKPYKSNGGEMVDSALGEIPEGWTVGKLGDYCKVKSGYAFKSSGWKNDGVKVVKIKNIESSNTLNLNDCSCVSEDKIDFAKDFLVKDGDLLIAMTGATIGKFAIVPMTHKPLLVNQRVGKFFLGDNPKESLPFLYCVLKKDEVINEIINRGQGSAQPNISPSDIGTIEIVYPTNNIICLFNEKLLAIFKLLIDNNYQNQTLAQLRDILLPKLMSNQLKI